MKEPNDLTYKEIPQGLIDEIKQAYNGVTFDLDSDITPTTYSRRAYYKEKSTELTEGVTLDPETSELVAVKGYETTHYLVRYDEPANTVRRVRTASTSTIEEVLGPVEPKQDAATTGDQQPR